jgi:hypothetical protein
MTRQRRTSEPLPAVALIRLRRFWLSAHERFMRDVVAMALRHPERFTSRSRRREREILATCREELWPGREYTAIVSEELGGKA